MPRRLLYSLVLILFAGTAALLTAGGQSPSPPIVPAKHTELAPSVGKARDLSKLTPQQRVWLVAARQGMDWLRRTNKQDGRFVYGFVPELRTPLEGDSFTAQAGAAFALARAARFFGDEPSLAISRQSLLTLILDTTVDPRDKEIRHTAAPPQLVNRLSGQGQLILAIYELPQPGQDLLAQADQLCNYLRLQQHPSGALLVGEAGEDPKSAAQESALECAGVALHGLVRSQQLRPAPWKLDLARKARAFAQGCWEQKKTFGVAVSYGPALAEAYRLTREQAFADSAYAMADWLCELQYEAGDSVRAAWVGGFRPLVGGRAVQLAPDIRSAEAAECLAEMCRLARAAGNLPRLQRYSRALEESLRFLQTLQYSEKRTQHFVEEYRPALVGAFHASAQDGKMRIDYTQHALAALVAYLEHVAEY
jgi:hypothetical protein